MLELSSNTVDLFIFMGQSNMAGRGISNEKHPEGPPILNKGAGYEYRAISNPGQLSALCEPFGINENRADGIHEPGRKTGSLVTSFVNAYHSQTKIPVIAISAAEGGTSILEWQPGERLLEDGKQRLQDGLQYLRSINCSPRHTYMVWCQGESDGDRGITGDDYQRYFERMLGEMQALGVEKCFMIRIGEYNGPESISYRTIIEAQNHIARVHPEVIMVSLDFAVMKEKGGMKDAFHYYQWVYNQVGQVSGMNAAAYVETGKQPVLYDEFYKTTFTKVEAEVCQ